MPIHVGCPCIVRKFSFKSTHTHSNAHAHPHPHTDSDPDSDIDVGIDTDSQHTHIHIENQARTQDSVSLAHTDSQDIPGTASFRTDTTFFFLHFGPVILLFEGIC